MNLRNNSHSYEGDAALSNPNVNTRKPMIRRLYNTAMYKNHVSTAMAVCIVSECISWQHMQYSNEGLLLLFLLFSFQQNQREIPILTIQVKSQQIQSISK